MPRRSFKLSQKIEILEEQKREELSNKDIARRHNLDPNQIRRWQENRETWVLKPKRLRSLNAGRPSLHQNCEHGLLDFIRARREQGFSVTVRSLTWKLSELLLDGGSGDFEKRRKWIYKFLMRRHLSIRRVTRQTTLDDTILQERLGEFRSNAEAVYYAFPNILFVNMDQTALRYEMLPNTTVEVTGSRSVRVRRKLPEETHITAVLAVASDGRKLRPMLIFKAAENGRVAREFARRENPYPPAIEYATSPNAWMTVGLMQRWLETVFFPFAFECGSPVCLILDSLPIHLNQTISTEIRERGCQLLFVPGGLTADLQPLDVGINGPLKHWMRERTVNNQHFGILNASEKRHRLAILLDDVWKSIGQDVVVNSFNRIFATFDENPEDFDEIYQ